MHPYKRLAPWRLQLVADRLIERGLIWWRGKGVPGLPATIRKCDGRSLSAVLTS